MDKERLYYLLKPIVDELKREMQEKQVNHNLINIEALPNLLKALQQIFAHGKLPHTLIYGRFRYSILSDEWNAVVEACEDIGLDMRELDEDDD